MCESPTDYCDFASPEIEIVDVPVLVCSACGLCHLPTEVIRRLAVILDVALARADEDGLGAIRWNFTEGGVAGTCANTLRKMAATAER
jgi:hypothetical protein